MHGGLFTIGGSALSVPPVLLVIGSSYLIFYCERHQILPLYWCEEIPNLLEGKDHFRTLPNFGFGGGPVPYLEIISNLLLGEDQLTIGGGPDWDFKKSC